MKLKNTLGLILAMVMAFSTMATSVLANELPEQPFDDENQKSSPIMLLSGSEPKTWSDLADISWYDDTKTEFVLTTAQQLAGFAALVDGSNTFEEKTVKLGADIDLQSLLFNPIGSYRNDTAFKGVFDGQNYTIKNLSQNTWELNTGYYYGDLGLGLFGLVEDATIKNLKIDGAEISGESAICGTVAATAYGNCTFENIKISNASVADYQYYAGGVIGWASGNHKYIDINVDKTTTVAAQWGDFDNSTGGVIGGCGGSATIYMQDCNVACRIDAYNDVTSSYQWYAYRRCGMLIGNTGKTETVGGSTVGAAPQLTAKNCTVTYGDWANYTYCEFAGKNWPYVRVQAGVSNSAYSNPRYGHPTDANGKEVVDDNHKHNDGEDHMILCVFDQLFGGGQGVYGTASHDGVDIIYDNKVAMVENVEHFTLQSAIDATNGTGTIKVIRDINESVTVKAPGTSTYTTVTIDLDGFTLTGNIIVEDGATANIKNGTIINDDKSISAIQSFGTTTLENVDITSARHAVRVEGGTTTINGGTYKVGTKDMTTHAVNVSDGGKVVINDGVFEGPAGVADSDSGAAINVQADSTVEIYGGKFGGGKTNTLAGNGTFVLKGGMYDQDPTALLSADYEVVFRGAYDYPYTVEPKAASAINVTLVKVDDSVYNIVLTSADDYNIYEFVSAELTFKNESTTVGGGDMNYEISGFGGTTAQRAADADKNNQFIISVPDGETKRISGNSFVIGQVTFVGQGVVNFSVVDGFVATTRQNTNLGRYYDVDDSTLNITDAKITNGHIQEVKRDVTVNVAFNHNIRESKYWDDDMITVTIKDGFGNVKTQAIEITSASAGNCTFADVQLGRLTVTLQAPGFRKYVYETTLEDGDAALVLNFWNDVKRNDDEVIEAGKTAMDKNFVVGDIVMDYNVDKYDLAAVTSYYGSYDIDTAQAEKYIQYDLNRDGNIDIRDVQYVLHTMGN